MVAEGCETRGCDWMGGEERGQGGGREGSTAGGRAASDKVAPASTAEPESAYAIRPVCYQGKPIVSGSPLVASGKPCICVTF